MTTPKEQNTHDHDACVKLFTDTLERLNEISVNQMQAVLDIAIAAADAASSISPSNTTGEAFVEKVAKLVGDLKSKADSVAGGVGTRGGAPVEHDASADEKSKFCEIVERGINTAIENSLSNQQELYVIGAAVLTEGANLVLGSGGNH